jgi:hypothetical protein
MVNIVEIVSELMRGGAMMTVLSTLVAALAWPATLVTAFDLIDSKWAIAIDRYVLLLVVVLILYPCKMSLMAVLKQQTCSGLNVFQKRLMCCSKFLVLSF